MSLSTDELLTLRRSQLSQVMQFYDTDDFRHFMPGAIRQAIYMGEQSMRSEIASLEAISEVEKERATD